MGVRTLKKIREGLGLTRWKMSKLMGRSIQNYLDLENYAIKLDLSDIKLIRELAKKAGLNDTDLLDSLESDPRYTKKRPKKN